MGLFDYAAYGLAPPVERRDPPEGPALVAGLVEAAAARSPRAPALIGADRRYDFTALADAVSRAAALLDALGIRPGDRVAASLPNRCDIVVAFFAAMRLGAVWVGVSQILPLRDKLYILSHSGTKLLLADDRVAGELSGELAGLIDLSAGLLRDDDPRWLQVMDGTGAALAPSPQIDPYAPAAIMYTSGTTGTPKGVTHSQHNIIVVPLASFAHGALNPESRRGSVLPLTICNIMILGPVSAYLRDKPFILGTSAKIDALLDWAQREDVENMSFVPTMVYDLLNTDRDLPPGLRPGSGGAPLPHALREKFEARYGYPLESSYGLTEAPTVVAIPQGQRAPEGSSGRVLPHMQLSIRDANNVEMSAGEIGEVCFCAVDTGCWAHVYAPPLGYWMDAAKTSALLAGGVVHSGDHGHVDADGWLTIADRSSELILRGGSNVYPAEIERLLHTHPLVADCAVVGRPDDRMGMLTIACVLPTSQDIDTDALQAELTALCRDTLTRYKIPDFWTFVDSFPRNAMGKIIKPKLREIVNP